MGKRRGSLLDKPSKDREDSWKNIFKGLVDLIQDQQRQLESLVKERKYLQKRIQSQHDRWVSDVKLLEDHIAQMMRDSKIKDMTRFVESAKAKLIVFMKQKEAIMHKLKLDDIEDERADLKLLFDELSRCLAEPKCVTRSHSKDIDVSALKSERDFAWNQYKKTDAKLQEQVMITKSEVEAANKKVEQLISDLEESQSSNMEKNRTILVLKDDITKLKSDSRKKTEEISRLAKELELLRSSNNNDNDNDINNITPVLRRCMVESGIGDKNSRLDHSQACEKGGRRSSKRKRGEMDSNVEKPRLFSSKFKVPKLKVSSPW